jgi:hypothetical protein
MPCDITAAGQNCNMNNTKSSPPPSMSQRPYGIPSRSPIPSLSPSASEMPIKSPMESSSPSASEMPIKSPMESSSPSASEMPTRSSMPTTPPTPSSTQMPTPPPTHTPIPPQSPPPSQKASPPPTQSAKPTRLPSRVPSNSVKPNQQINTYINFKGLDRQQVTTNTLQNIQGSIGCALNVPASNIILQNATFTDTTGTRYNVPFDPTFVNQQTVSCTTSGVRSLRNVKDVKSLQLTVKDFTVKNIRKLQTTTILTVNYIIMNPSNDLVNMNETQLETLVTSSPFIASVGLGAPQQSTVASGNSNNNLVTEIAAPLGAIAAIAIIAVVALMVYNNNRKT